MTSTLILNILANITLTSSVVGRACPGEVVTYTCMVDQAATVGWTAAPVLTDPTAVLFLATSDHRTRDCRAVSSIRCTDLDFHATFRTVSAVQNGFADLNSTFRFTATAERNRTVVLCSAATENNAPRASQNLSVAGKHMTISSSIFMKYQFIHLSCYIWYFCNQTTPLNIVYAIIVQPLPISKCSTCYCNYTSYNHRTRSCR